MNKPDNAVKINLKSNKKISICTCGKSDSLPFCDNRHREINKENGTHYKSVKIFPENDTNIWVSSTTWEKHNK